MSDELIYNFELKKSFLKITWFKDSMPLPASTRYTTDYDLNTGVVTLRISDVNMNDVGFYHAFAEVKICLFLSHSK
jgi:hypothetical protein